MNEKKLQEYKENLLRLKSEILNNGNLRKTEDLHISSDDLPDEADFAQSVINQQVSFSMRAREIQKLRMIELALERIETSSFGHCEDCDEPINEKRLTKQPWTTLCITHAEEREREDGRFGRAV